MKKEKECLRETKRSEFAGLCNSESLIGGERKTISLSQSSVLGNKEGAEEKQQSL